MHAACSAGFRFSLGLCPISLLREIHVHPAQRCMRVNAPQFKRRQLLQVPLSYDYAPLIPSSRHYTLRGAVELLEQRNMKVRSRPVQRGRGRDCMSGASPSHPPWPPSPHKVGLVLDLTNSNRYYTFHLELPDAGQRGIHYRTVGDPACDERMRPRLQPPQPPPPCEYVINLPPLTGLRSPAEGEASPLNQRM